MFELIQGYLYLYACKLVYNIIYVFSCCQIKYKNGVKYAKRIYDKWMNMSSSNQEHVITKRKDKLAWVQNGRVIRWVNPSCLFENEEKITFEKNTNMLYITSCPDNASSENHLFLCDGDKIMGETFCEKTSYTFISIQVTFKKETMEPLTVNLKLPNINYYVAGNVLNSAFIKHYAIKHSGLNPGDLNEEGGEYDMQVIDGNAHFFTITYKEEIVLLKHSYYVRPMMGGSDK